MRAGERWRHVRDLLPRGGALPSDLWERRHLWIMVLAWLHVPVGVVIEVVERHAEPGTVGAGLLAAALAAGGLRGSQRRRSSMVTASLMVSTALFIHLFNGLIEVHFHFFVLLAVVALYQAWAPYLVALAIVLVHHAVMGVLDPTAVYNHPAAIAHPVWFAVIHTSFVLAESIACLAYWGVAEHALDAERAQRIRAEEIGEELARANTQVSDLLAMMSHDLKAPVAVVTGYGQMALESWRDLDESTREAFVRKMVASGHALDQMLAETLALAALDTEELQTRPVAVRVDQALFTVLDALSEPLPHVRVDAPATTALVDKGQLTHMLTNLVTNAAKYGAPPFALSLATTDTGVEVRVSDGGSGVPADFVPQLFDRYARSDKAQRGSVKGTGLGLYIVRKLVEANHGTVEYEPRPGGGSVFVLRLRRAPHLADQIGTRSRSVVDLGPGLDGPDVSAEASGA